MAGYIAGATAYERPFQDLIGSLPATLKANGVDAQYRAFGRSVTDILPDGATQLQKAAWYGCPSGNIAKCDNQESRLDAVFAEVAKAPDDMAVVITDLWFTNSDIQTSGNTALKPQLADILTAGRTIAVYGIDAPFAGRIYDLTDAAGTKLPVTVKPGGRHPLFMIVVGSKRQVVQFGKEFERSGSKALASGIAEGRIKRSLFTIDPGPEVGRDPKPLDPGKHPRLVQTVFEPANGVEIQQFALRPGLPPRRDAPQPMAPSWTGPKDNAFLPDAVWQGDLSPKTRIWFRKDQQCKPTSWQEARATDEGWEALSGGGKMKLAIDPARIGPRLSQSGVYLISGELRRTSVLSPNPANEWMRGTWNLAPEAAAQVSRTPPPMFPTLNLSEVARLMEESLATAAERKQAAVMGFSVLVQVEK